MNKLIIFDLDGVLIDSKEIHFEALNLALAEVDSKYVISKVDQDRFFEGLTTKTKLDILTNTRGLDKNLHKDIWVSKQKYSSALFLDTPKDQDLINIFRYIKDRDILIGVASNSIRTTLDSCLEALGIAELIDCSLSNEDVLMPKPSPEIYLSCMKHLNVKKENVAIFEDSDIGLIAARDSKARLVVKVESRKFINIEKIMEISDSLHVE